MKTLAVFLTTITLSFVVMSTVLAQSPTTRPTTEPTRSAPTQPPATGRAAVGC